MASNKLLPMKGEFVARFFNWIKNSPLPISVNMWYNLLL